MSRTIGRKISTSPLSRKELIKLLVANENVWEESQDAGTICLTPLLAKTFLGMCSPKQRPLSESHVKKWVQAMSRGEWTRPGDAITFSHEDDEGRVWMLNGQHRCAAVFQSGCTISVLVSLDHDDDDYLAQDQGKLRQASEYIGNVPNNATVAAALKLLYLEELQCEMPKGRVQETLDDYPEVLDAPIAQLRKVNLAPSLGVYLWVRTQRIDSEASDRFWAAVFSGTQRGHSHGETENDPALRFRNRLLEVGRGVRLSPQVTVTFCIKAWRAHLAGESVKLLRWSSGELPPEWPES